MGGSLEIYSILALLLLIKVEGLTERRKVEGLTERRKYATL
jgi:hypothetical protein